MKPLLLIALLVLAACTPSAPPDGGLGGTGAAIKVEDELEE